MNSKSYFFLSLLIDHSSLLNLSVQPTCEHWWSMFVCGGGRLVPLPLPHPNQWQLTFSLVPAKDPGKLKAAENSLTVLKICSVPLWGWKILGMRIVQEHRQAHREKFQKKASLSSLSITEKKKLQRTPNPTFTRISCYICIDCWKFFLVRFQAALCPWSLSELIEKPRVLQGSSPGISLQL